MGLKNLSNAELFLLLDFVEDLWQQHPLFEEIWHSKHNEIRDEIIRRNLSEKYVYWLLQRGE